jgi:hypothetical protein
MEEAMRFVITGGTSAPAQIAYEPRSPNGKPAP